MTVVQKGRTHVSTFPPNLRALALAKLDTLEALIRKAYVPAPAPVQGRTLRSGRTY